MGCHQSKTNDSQKYFYQFSIATLNYSGILTSPYEFYSNQDKQQKLYSESFCQIVSKVYPKFMQNESNFNWHMESIDPNWKSRYATINMIQAGVNPKTKKMMTGNQFLQTWQEFYEKTKDTLRKDYFQKKHKQNIEEQMQIQIKRCKQFDYFCYQTMLKIYCGVDIQNMKNDVDSTQYLKRRKEWFDKSYLNDEKKFQKTINFLYLKNLCIMYFQETNKKLIEKLKQRLKQKYLVKDMKDSKSIILLKKDILKNQNLEDQNKEFLIKYSNELLKKKKIQLSPKDIEIVLNFNKDSVFQYLNQYNLLLINVHLNSKTKKNQVQLESLKKQYTQLLQIFPQIDILLGGDFNTVMKKQYFQLNKKKSEIIPSQINCFSVKKKRTFMQPQRKKANFLDLAAKDFLISTIQNGKGVVTTIQENQLESIDKLPLLPNESHPYDHFMVKGTYYLKKDS